MTVVVCDTSVLSYLALMDRLDLLSILFGRVIIPEAVLAECLHLGAPEHLRMSLLPNLPAFAVVKAAGPHLPEAHRRNLLDFDLIMTQLKQHGFRVSDSLVLAAHRELGLV